MIKLNVRTIARSAASGRLVLTKTVIKTIAAYGKAIGFSAQDVAYSINSQLPIKSQHVTEKEVEQVIKKLVADFAQGYIYHDMKGKVTANGRWFYDYQ